MTLRQQPVARLLSHLVVAVALGSIGYQLWQAWPQLRDVRPAALPVAIALLCGGASLLLSALLWRNTLGRLGAPLTTSVAVRIWFASQIARYAPGNIWHLLGRAYLAQQAGVAAPLLSLSLMLEMLQTITAALVVAAASLIFWRQQNVFGLWTLLLAPLLICYTWPQLLQRPMNALLQKLGRPSTGLRLQRHDLFAVLPGYCATWLVYGCGLYLLARSIYPLPLEEFPMIVGSFAIAWVVGFLSFITPSGLGVREGVLSYLLAQTMPLPVALLLALLARIWLTLAEMICVALVVWKRRPE